MSKFRTESEHRGPRRPVGVRLPDVRTDPSPHLRANKRKTIQTEFKLPVSLSCSLVHLPNQRGHEEPFIDPELTNLKSNKGLVSQE